MSIFPIGWSKSEFKSLNREHSQEIQFQPRKDQNQNYMSLQSIDMCIKVFSTILVDKVNQQNYM